MIKSRVLPSELEKASDFADKYKKGNYGKNVLEVKKEEYFEFIRIGKLCELVFTRILRKNNIEVICDEMLKPCKDQHRKGPDLILSHSGQEVDIKAANKHFHKRLLVREDQFKAHIHDLYVGAKYVNDKWIEFHGYIDGESLKEISPKDFGYGLCRHIMLEDLKPIERFIHLSVKKKKVD